MNLACRLSITIVIYTIWLSPSLAQLSVFPRLSNVTSFADFISQTGKTYENVNEYYYRETIFTITKNFIDLTNKYADTGLSSLRLNLNTLADRKRMEVFRLMGSKISNGGENIASQHANYINSNPSNLNLPESFDWREKGGVTPVRFQGIDCGACWSFATIGALEGHLFRRTGFLVSLSEQELVDCSDMEYGNMGCDGGFQEYAFEYIRNHGVSLATDYPYSQMKTDCKQNGTINGVQIRDYVRIKPGDEQKMKEVVATLGPVACSINADTVAFDQYMSGIFDDEECNKGDVNHSILVVGYGTENGRDYWIIKNSYSENWGENGFFKLLRNQNSFCGIANECSYPVL